MTTTWKSRWLSRPHPTIVGLFLVISLVALWRGSGTSVPLTDRELHSIMVDGTVVRVVREEQMAPTIGSRTTRVQELLVRIQDPSKGQRDVLVNNDLTPLSVGDGIYVNAMSLGTDHESFNILDVKRSSGLLWLLAGFVALVLGVSGFKGINALVGMVFSVAVIFAYVVPTIIGGANPVFVGLIASAIILVGTFYVSYGFDGKSVSALIGIVATLILVGCVGQLVVHVLHFTGYGDENAIYLTQQMNNGVNLVGLAIAGIIIATVGVLDDVAITQSSTVYVLAKTGQARGWALFRHAMEVGTDHISGVINTLMLAYAGASLPLLLLLRLSRFPMGFALGGEMIAQEIVRTLVSSAGLVLAVPLTTAIAVLFVDRWGISSTSSIHHH